MAQVIARQRLYLTADRKKLVPEGDKKAATLYAAVGDIIPDSAAQRFGLVDGALKGFKAETGGAKERQPAPNKERAPGEDKGRQGNGSDGGQGAAAPKPDDLAELKGVGAKTASALAAAGFTTFAAIAAIDAANPPQVEGLPAVFKWADVVTDAKAKAPAQEPQG